MDTQEDQKKFVLLSYNDKLTTFSVAALEAAWALDKEEYVNGEHYLRRAQRIVIRLEKEYSVPRQDAVRTTLMVVRGDWKPE